jgi:tRNA dimethylallyltransferase
MPPVIFIFGPTASGKSAVAEQLARDLGGEIVSVDSAQVYRGMDVGTAKPSAAIRAEIPHHLLDLTEPTEAYSAADWASAAERAISDICDRGKRAIVCGGTMLYARALLFGFDTLPGADAGFREALRGRAAELGWPALHAELAAVDATTAARLNPNDGTRIERALEVYALTGQPISALHHQQGEPTLRVPWPCIQVGLVPRDRAVLHARIAERFRAMAAAGLLDEVRALTARHPTLNEDSPAMRAVGYRQALSEIHGEYATPGEWIERGIFATRQLAKRQLTWLRTWPHLHSVDSMGDALGAIRNIIETQVSPPA